jgi:hypothetical protein
MRLLILTCPGPLSWSAHYVDAFREQADCLVVGPAPEPDTPNAIRFDAHLEFDPPGDLAAVLPARWEPDAVIGITGPGGKRLHPEVPHWPWPAAFLTVDTWQCLMDYRDALGYDFTFVAQRPFVESMRAAGAANVAWLPLAANPACHYPLPDTTPEWDVAFAGAWQTAVHAERGVLLDQLSARFRLRRREHVYGDEMCRLYASARLGFNHAAVREVNMRVFETLAMGRCLLTDVGAAMSGLFDLFEDGRHLVAYNDAATLIAHCRDYLEDDNKRQAIAQAGREWVLSHHTYAHRVAEVLDKLQPHTTTGVRHVENTNTALHAHLPRVPGRLLDLGLALDVSRVRLKRMGVDHVTGAHDDPAIREARRGSYHELIPQSALPENEFDTVCLDIASNSLEDPDASITRAWKALVPGGTLVLRTPERAGTDWERTLAPYDLQVRRVAGDKTTCVIQARKRTRPLRWIVADYFHTLNLPGYDPDDISARIPDTW